MINPLSLFPAIKALMELRRTVKEIPIDKIEDIDHIPTIQKLNRNGARFRFSRKSKIYTREQNGWKVFQLRDWIGRPSTFTDRNGDAILMYTHKQA